MSKWQQTNKLGTHLIEQFQTYVVQALQLIRQWCQPQIGSWSFSSIRGKVSLFFVGVSLSLAIVASAARNSVSQGDVKLTLVSFSVNKAAYEIKEFFSRHRLSLTKRAKVEAALI